MEITPWVGNEALTASSVVITVNLDDRKRAQQLVARTQTIQVVDDSNSFQAAKRLAGEAKALLDEIEASKKAAKQPFIAIGRAVDQLVIEVGTPVAEEHRRILHLLNGYVAEMERKAKEEAHRKAEAERIRQAEMERKIREAEAKAAAADLRARKAQDETERLRLQKEASERQLALAQAQLEKDLSEELARLGADKPKPSLVSNGRVDHPLKFELTDIKAVVKAGQWRLLKWTLDVRACQDSCRSQMETAPSVEPFLPGIKITREISVSVRASARTE